MRLTNYLDEVAHSQNVGFEELTQFYEKATNKQIKEMERILKNNNWQKFKELIYRVLNIKLN